MTLTQEQMDWRFANVQMMRAQLGTATKEQIKWLIDFLQVRYDKLNSGDQSNGTQT